MIIFVDASFLIALLHTKDDFHSKAQKIITQVELESIYPLTSNIAIAEVVNYIFRLKGPKNAKKYLGLIKKTGIKEVFVDQEIFAQGYHLLFTQKTKRGLNLFDCLHLATMKTLGIDAILTYDKGFKKEVKVIG